MYIRIEVLHLFKSNSQFKKKLKLSLLWKQEIMRVYTRFVSFTFSILINLFIEFPCEEFSLKVEVKTFSFANFKMKKRKKKVKTVERILLCNTN